MDVFPEHQFRRPFRSIDAYRLLLVVQKRLAVKLCLSLFSLCKNSSTPQSIWNFKFPNGLRASCCAEECPSPSPSCIFLCDVLGLHFGYKYVLFASSLRIGKSIYHALECNLDLPVLTSPSFLSSCSPADTPHVLYISLERERIVAT